MTQTAPDKPDAIFGPQEQLRLHQLRILEWAAAQNRESGQTLAEAGDGPSVEAPAEWKLLGDVTLYDWQHECLKRWFTHEGRGTVKVVTGGGKTLLAMAIAECLQNRGKPDLRMAIVVPTIVLMNQWYDEFRDRGNLPAACIGRLGGGYKHDFSGNRRVLISVLASARRELAGLVKKAGVGDKLLFVADECHRLGAKEMSQVLDTERLYSLGLSATPERGDEDGLEWDDDYDDSLLGKALGPIIYEFTLADALRLGVIPPFTIRHYALPLTDTERANYERLSRSISDLRSELRNYAPAGTSFFQWVRQNAARGKGEVNSYAARLVAETNRRKELLYGIEARSNAVVDLLTREFANNPNARAILFHESIDEVMALYAKLWMAGLPAIAEHSKLPEQIREAGLELFRQGIARIIVSARSLIEGFNVPAADIGIIVASSTSVRQRIQSLGRVLRKHRTESGEEKTSCIHVLYAKDTVDEIIYEKLDWNDATGVEANVYLTWIAGQDPKQEVGPPRSPLPVEGAISPEILHPGDVYPGRYEGDEWTCDTSGNVRDVQGRYAMASQELANAVRAIKGAAGRFRITKGRHFVLVRVPDGDDWSTLYIGQLPHLPQVRDDAGTTAPIVSPAEVEAWIAQARPGNPYPFESVPIVDTELRFRGKRGGVLSRRVRGGEVFARVGQAARDVRMGRDAERVITAIRAMESLGQLVTRLEVNELRHVLCREGGRLLFLCALEQGLEFPEP